LPSDSILIPKIPASISGLAASVHCQSWGWEKDVDKKVRLMISTIIVNLMKAFLYFIKKKREDV
jgi:hypothetical protein